MGLARDEGYSWGWQGLILMGLARADTHGVGKG